MRLLCIDPGTEVSGVVIFDTETREVTTAYPAIDNNELIEKIGRHDKPEGSCDHMAIEMIASYGMAVGQSTFETVLWIGRFMEAFGAHNCTKVYRKDVKMHLCNSMRAKDPNVRMALFDLFPATGGGKTPQVGTKSQPGPLFGVSKHAVSALAVGVTFLANSGRELAA